MTDGVTLWPASAGHLSTMSQDREEKNRWQSSIGRPVRQPREKLLQRGPDALSDANLLAIFLRTGISRQSAVDLAPRMLGAFGSLTADCRRQGRLLRAARHGAGQVRAAEGSGGNGAAGTGRAVVGRQCVSARQRLCASICSSSCAACRARFFMALFVDAQNPLIAAEELFRGT